MLEVGLVRTPERAPEREIAEQSSWWCRSLDLAPNRAERDRDETRSFEHVGEHTHGARAERSNRREQHHVDTVAAQHAGAGRT